MSFISNISQKDLKKSRKIDSGNSSGNYSSSDDSFIDKPPPAPVDFESDDVENLIETIQEMKVKVSKKEKEVIKMRNSSDKDPKNAVGEKLTRRKSSSTSGHGTDSSYNRLNEPGPRKSKTPKARVGNAIVLEPVSVKSPQKRVGSRL